MDQYEYKSIAFEDTGPSQIENLLNKFWEKGWELVSLVSNYGLGSGKYALVGIDVRMMAILKQKQLKGENINDG